MHRKGPLSLLSLCLVLSPVLANSSKPAICNANHIFNAIHSTMRQWGGSLNHNGMSLFLATVPEGTQLYHGTSNPEFIEGMQWLAFEPEHALIFARPHGGPRGPPPGIGQGAPPRDDRQPDVEGMLHDGEGWKYHERPSGYGVAEEHGNGSPPPHRDEHHGRPHQSSLYDGKDCDHHLSPPIHECNPRYGTDRCPRPPQHEHGPPPPDHERGPRKHGEHGPPPPLPPGHIYKPYPPPPRKDRTFKGPSGPEHRRPPPSEHRLLQDHRDIPPDTHHRPPLPHHSYDFPREPIELRSTPQRQRRHTQQLLLDTLPSREPPQEEHTGYLHTYVPTHDLHLLYIDGLSAGKTSNGTLDTQDLLLLNLTSGSPGAPGGPMGGEMARAEGLCSLAATVWEGRIDGFIRLEGGFEIILCSFEAHLHRESVVRVSPITEGGRGGRGGIMGGFEYLKAITSRYHGIGGGRVKVDYDDFVTVFGFDGAAIKGLWDNDVRSDVRMPRLTNVAPNTLHTLREDVTRLILAKDWDTHDKTHDWQAAADMVVARYSAPLHHIISTPSLRSNKAALTAYLSGLLRPFIDSPARNASLETARCVAQVLPPLSSLSIPPASLPPLAHRALHAVTTRICDTLLTSYSIASSALPHSSFSPVYAEHAVEVVDELVDWLGWTTWKECGTCGDEEVCFIPIWPQGSLEDHAQPRCRNESEVVGRSGYWGHMGPPRGTGEAQDRKKGQKDM